MKNIPQWNIIRIGKRVAQYLSPMRIPVHSASTSFFLILSAFPGVVILFAILGFTSFDVGDVLNLLSGVLPEAFLPALERMLTGAYDNTSGTMLSLAIVVALWSASRGMWGLMQGMNAVYGVQERRNYFVTRALCIGYTLAFLVVLVMTLVLQVFGNSILDYLRMTTNPVMLFIMNIIDLRLILLLLLQISLFTAMYAVLPNERNHVVSCLPGALLASVGWMIFSQLFSVYVEHFHHYSNIFGSVYAVALALLWLHCCIYIVFLGGALNRYLMERK